MNVLDLVLLSVFFLCFLRFLFYRFMLYRADWAYKERMEILEKEGIEEYEKLPDFNTVLKKYWIWDIQKFKGSKNKIHSYNYQSLILISRIKKGKKDEKNKY